ncbi:uncharacterized protein L201_002262 [Kwoniella dendrophila CBS 6074]|uniref:SH3 domain-containing protein n=1 Tax=Kwoniella dendrophila CBS 6074 TaxID=1295534 RepID=A0AAX4JSC3_9TREE
MSQTLDPIIRPNDDDESDHNRIEPTSTRRISTIDTEEEDKDTMALPIAATSTNQITSASAVSSVVNEVPKISTSAVASTTAPVVGQNPATPQSSTAKSTIVSSVQAVPSTTSTSTTSSTALKPSTTSTTTSSAKPTLTSSTTSSHPSSSSASASRALSSSASVSKVSTSSASSSATKAASENGKHGIGGSGLSLGALVGIIIGGIVAIVLIGIIATRTIRKKQRKDRAAKRSSMFEWPATNMEEEPYEKPRYEPPSQSYAMSDAYNTSGNNGGSVAYVTTETAYAPIPTQTQPPQNYMERNNPQYSYGNNNYQPSYPPQQPQYPQYQENVVPPPQLAPIIAPQSNEGGLRDGSMVRVNVGFVRSLEDELAISPGQQLYLHQMYDDGWCLCEDSNQNRGVVPISCLQPTSNGDNNLAPNMMREGSGGSAGSAGERLQRRSSLYREQH